MIQERHIKTEQDLIEERYFISDFNVFIMINYYV